MLVGQQSLEPDGQLVEADLFVCRFPRFFRFGMRHFTPWVERDYAEPYFFRIYYSDLLFVFPMRVIRPVGLVGIPAAVSPGLYDLPYEDSEGRCTECQEDDYFCLHSAFVFAVQN